MFVSLALSWEAAAEIAAVELDGNTLYRLSNRLVEAVVNPAAGGRVESRFRLERISASHRNELKSGIRHEYADQ